MLLSKDVGEQCISCWLFDTKIHSTTCAGSMMACIPFRMQDLYELAPCSKKNRPAQRVLQKIDINSVDNAKCRSLQSRAGIV